MATHLYELVHDRARQHPTAIAFGAQHGLSWRTLTGTQVGELVDRLAVELAAEGVKEGDRVVLWMPNHWRTPLYHFALWKLGAVVVPFDRETNPEAGARILESVQPRCAIVGHGERPSWLQGFQVREWWEPGTKATGSGQQASGEDVGAVAGSPLPVAWSPWQRPTEELAAIVFTSGTTGSPKGCMITHANLCSQVEALRYTVALDETSRLASILPLSHLFELTVGMLYPFSMGAAVHYIPSRRGPDIVRVLAEQRITHMLVVPQFLTVMGRTVDDQLRSKLPGPVYTALMALASHMPLSSRRYLFRSVHRRLGGRLKLIASGGAALPPETQLLWQRLGVRVVQGYGASECSPVIACGKDDGSTPVGSVGKPLRGVEVRLSADGELLVRGPNVMRGYWNDPERTAEAIHDGWYATGDLGTIDPDGNITISGRAKDLIVLPSGLNVWPQDVEDVLRADPAVGDAAVIAVPSAAGGATLHAYLLPARPGAGADDLAAIIGRANGRLAQHQRLATASWWNEAGNDADFPRTAIGKVRRAMLPLPEQAQTTRVEAAMAADDPVAQAVAGVARVARVQPEQTLAELGLDSFGLVELSLAIEEKTGKAVSDGDLSTDMTVEQVRRLVVETQEGDGVSGALTGDEAISTEQPLWPYTWGRFLRALSLPFDALYRLMVTKTVVLGGEHLRRLPRRVVFAGTHHSFADLPLIRFGLAQTPARRLAGRLVVATAAGEYAKAGPLAEYGRLAFGLYPLRQRGEREASLRGLARLAEAGNAVLIFPQGEHANPELERAGDPSVQFRPGVAHLVAALDAAVVPFGLAGTELMMPPEREVFHGLIIAGVPVSIRRGPLAIAFGAPMSLGPGEEPQAFAARLQEASFALARQAEKALEDRRARR